MTTTPTLSGVGCPWYLPDAVCDVCAEACKATLQPAIVFALTVAAIAVAGGAVTIKTERSSRRFEPNLS